MPAPKFLVDPDNILRSVDIVFQVFAKAAYRHNGLFPAVTERQNGNMLMDCPLPPPIPGQRNSDRAPRGCNLSHDVGLLAALDGLGQAMKRERYLIQREAYLQEFAKTCAPVSPTGLLPWGEHSFWNLHLKCIGNSYMLQYHEQPFDVGLPTHHQLGRLPFRDWQTIHAANPDVLPRFVRGLDWHWDDEERTKFNRHAPITQFIRGYQVKRGEHVSGKPHKESTGSDFPGAAGVFIHDYASALALVENPDPQWKQDLMDFCDSWWNRRLDSGLLPKSGAKSKLGWNGIALGMTRGFGSSLLASGDLLVDADPELSALLIERGTSFIKAVLDVEQNRLDEGSYCSAFDADGTPVKYSQAWAGNRGQAATAKEILPVLAAAQRIGDQRGLEMAKRCAAIYHESFLPRDTIVRAGDPGAVISLVGELYRLTGDEAWRATALAHATDAMELFFDSPLPRCAHGRNHYESQQGSSTLVHSLARLVCITKDLPCIGGLAEPMS